MRFFNFTFGAGGTLSNILVSAKNKAIEENAIACLKFNGTDLEVSPDSNIRDIGMIYDLKRKLHQLKDYYGS